MLSEDVLYGSEIAVLAGFASTAVVLVLTSVLGIDVGRELRKLTRLLAEERVKATTPAVATPDATAGREEHFVFQVAEAKFHILFAGFTALFVSLTVCVLLIVLKDHQMLAWRISDVITLILHLNGATRLMQGTIKANDHTLKRWFMIAVGFVIATISLLAALGIFPAAQIAIVFIGILWTLVVTSVSFFTLLVEMLQRD